MLGLDGRPLERRARFQWNVGGGTEPVDAADVMEPEGEIQATEHVEDGGHREPFNPLQPAFRHHPHDDSYLDNPPLEPSEKTTPNAGYTYWLENLPPQNRILCELREAYRTFLRIISEQSGVENPGPTRRAS